MLHSLIEYNCNIRGVLLLSYNNTAITDLHHKVSLQSNNRPKDEQWSDLHMSGSVSTRGFARVTFSSYLSVWDEVELECADKR